MLSYEPQQFSILCVPGEVVAMSFKPNPVLPKGVGELIVVEIMAKIERETFKPLLRA